METVYKPNLLREPLSGAGTFPDAKRHHQETLLVLAAIATVRVGSPSVTGIVCILFIIYRTVQ